jgi:hypothetical protein
METLSEVLESSPLCVLLLKYHISSDAVTKLEICY